MAARWLWVGMLVLTAGLATAANKGSAPVEARPATSSAESAKQTAGLELIPTNGVLADKAIFWDRDLSVHAGFGYRDNILLSPFQRAGSPFLAVGAQAAIVGLGTREALLGGDSNGWGGAFLLDAEDLRYFRPAAGVDHEDSLLTMAQLRRVLSSDWQLAASLAYGYLDQVQDVSVTEADTAQARVLGHSLTFEPSLRRYFGAAWSLQLGFPLTRQWLAEPLDSCWKAGPKLALARDYGHGSEVRLSYGVAEQFYDTRRPLDPDLNEITGTHLTTWRHAPELVWRHYWDKKQRWRTTSTLGVDINSDNGSGFFDYRTFRVEEELRWRFKRFEARIRGGASYYDFPVRTLGDADAPKLHKTLVSLNVRLEQRLSGYLKLYAEYDWEQSLSNQDFEQYRVNTVSGGVKWEF